MFLVEFLLAVILGLVVAWLLVGPLGRRGPGPGAGFIFFFLLVFLMVWAGGAWIQPFGFVFAGTYLVPFILVGLLGLLLIAALIPAAEDRETTVRFVDPERRGRERRVAQVGLTAFFGLLIVLLLIAIAIRYSGSTI